MAPGIAVPHFPPWRRWVAAAIVGIVLAFAAWMRRA